MRSSAISNSSITVPHILKSVIINSPALIQYLGKILLPLNLTVYPIMQDITSIYGIISLVAIILAVYFSRNRDMKLTLFGVSWYLVFLLPSLISAKPGPNTMFLEHRVYVPMIGILIVLSETDIIGRIRAGINTSTITSAMIIIGLGYTAFVHSNAMRDPFSYWANAVAGSPHSAVAHINLGDKYYNARRLDLAEQEFRKAIELDPSQPIAHNNLGRIFAVRRMFKKAEEEFRKELEINPNSPEALYNLGTLNYDLGRPDRAVEYWTKVIQIDPYNINANRFLAVYYYRKGMLQEAQRYIQTLNEMGTSIIKR